jgi:O-antigen ligase
MKIILRIWTELGLPSEVLIVALLLLVFANMYKNKSKEVMSLCLILL